LSRPVVPTVFRKALRAAAGGMQVIWLHINSTDDYKNNKDVSQQNQRQQGRVTTNPIKGLFCGKPWICGLTSKSLKMTECLM